MRASHVVVVMSLGVASSSVGSAAPPRRTAAPPELGRFDFGDPEVLPVLRQQLHVEVDGQHVHTVSDLVHRNDARGRIEGVATLTLDPSAHVSGFGYWNGDAKITGEVLPRPIARTIYDETVGRRRDPGLLEQVGPGKYQLEVFPIEPRERKRTRFTWDQWLEQHSGEVSYRAPLVHGNAEVHVELTDARGISALRSTSHDLEITRRDGRTLVTARPKHVRGRELRLAWRVGSPAMTMHAWVHREAGEDGYVLVHVAAPPPDPAARVPKDVTIVLDESGSMTGAPMENGRRSAIAIVDALADDDGLNVVLFSDRTDALFDAPQRATKAVRQRARRFLAAAGDGGGTDLALALQTALDRQGDDARPKSVLLLTDGESSTAPALEVVEQDQHDVRVFTIGVGDQVHAPTLKQIAALKRGRYIPIATAAEIGPSMAQLYDRMAAPVFVGLSLEASGPTLVRTYPPTLPDLFAGDEVVIVGRVQGDGDLDLRLDGTTVAGPRSVRARITIPERHERVWVGSMWAQARIDDLLTRLALAPHDSDAGERIDEVTRLGVAYDLVTPYTSFLAIPEAELTERTRELLQHGREGRTERRELVRVLNLDEFRKIPVGEGTVVESGRDSTAVASRDSTGISLSGSTGAEPKAEGPPPSPRRPGAAHCSVGDTDTGPSSLPWISLAFVVLTRRRGPRPR